MANSQNIRNKVKMCEWCEYYPAMDGSNICKKCSEPSPKLLELWDKAVELR